MFGGSKPSFGTTTPGTGFGAFNQPAAASPFGQSAFGKPATSAFGQASTFGAQQTAPSLFGATAGQTQAPSLFGTANTTTAFGATTAAQPAFGSFAQPQQNTSIFGAAQPAANTTSLFGQQTTSAFGATIKPGGLGGFGQTAPQQTNSLFGQPAAPVSTSAFGTFGQTNTVTTNVFGSNTSAFGQPTAAGANSGTSIAKYQPTIGTDTLIKGGQPNNVNTKQHCITAMKEYEAKSLEELRLEDYTANRKGPQAGTSTTGGFFGATAQPNTGTGLFGATTQQTTGLFGQPAGATENKPLFGTSAFGQTNTSAFGANTQQQNNFLAKPFGQAANTGFGAPTQDASANPFGQKPAFGQPAAPSLFGQNPATSTAPAFGQQGFGGFGTTAGQQQPSMFGNTATDANKPAFGLGATSTANTGFGGFGNTATSTAGGGLFGQKPNTGFGTNTAFGATSQPNTGFSNFSLNNTSGSLFNNKPATTGFGAFGAQTSTAPLNFNAGSNSLFNNTANKPMFGNTLGTQQNTTGGGLFGGGGGAFGGGNTLGGAFGGGGLGANNNMMAAMQQQQQVPIHQQILSKVTSPYGDNPIFKDLKRNDETDATRATNPAAQKAILESAIGQFKITPKSNSSAIKVKPVGSALSKKSLFEGLEEFDASVESFSLKPNGKRLVLTPKATGSMIGTVGGNTSNQSPATTPLRQQNTNAANTSARNESFTGEIPTSSPVVQQPPKDNETSRRESWLHPNNLENMRQHNLNAGGDTGSPLNSTLSELVPRKPLETYRPGTANARLSVSTVPENPFEDQTSISRRDTVSYNESSHGDSLFANRTFGTEDKSEEPQAEYEEHPTGITLKRIGYYTIPSMDDLKSYLAEDGSCVVPNFTVGREGYGNVYFGKEMDVAGLNLDEIVHFRNKEVIIYPDDDNKPLIGEGLNREAQVTLDQVWPLDKTKHEPIKDPQRLAEMEWESKLRRVCDKNDTRFIEYRPETGSWVFRVKHFSKYGLTDSDDEEPAPADPKKAKMGVPPLTMAGKPKDGMGQVDNITMASLKNAQKISEDAARALDPRALAAGLTGGYGMDESAEFMFMDKTHFYQNNGNDFAMYDSCMQNAFFPSPTAALAKDAGTDSHKLQLMKASFFLQDDREGGVFPPELQLQRDLNRNLPTAMMSPNAWKDPHGPTRGGLSGASSQMDFGLQTPPLATASSSASVMSVLREAPTEASSSAAESTVAVAATRKPPAKLPPFIVRPKVAQVKSLAVTVPFVKSIAHPWQLQWLNDLGFYNSRRFKMCFGPQNTLIVPTTSNNMLRDIKNENLHGFTKDIFKPRGKHDFSATLLQHVQINSVEHYDDFKRSFVEHLDIQLRHSLQEDVEGTECPWIRADGGTKLIAAHLEAAIKLLNLGPLEEYAVSVWSLCLTLWGDQEEIEGQDPSSHAVVMSRRNLLSQWLENAVTEKDLLTRNVSKHTYLDQMLELVMCHKVAEACELAFQYDDANLALLLAQLSSGPMVRQLMEDQLAAWNKNEADQFIQLERLKLFMLVAGVSLMTSAHGPINTVDGLEWIKVLALQLWYLSSPTASITDALLAYEKSFKSEEFYSTPPTPCYPEKYCLKIKRPELIYDLRYHLLKLFSKRSHPMEPLLNPATHTADPLDFRLSWLMLQTLEALGYRHCSPLCEQQLHTGLASQLENNEMWEWSIFVLLHIKERNQRELAIQNVLYRFVSVGSDVALTEREKFVINNLGVPEKWIDYAKAVRAGSVGKHHIQAKYLLRAKQWHLAHEVIFQHIAPDAIINDNLDYLYDLLSQFESPDVNNSKVPNWSNQGQIFLDFIDINEKFKALKTLQSDADIEARWENLKPQLSDLCSRINLLPCPTSKHRLCQSEIAQNLARLFRGVLLVCPVLNPCVTIKMALEKLPLPQEFAQQQLRLLLDTTMAALTKEMLWVSQEV